MSAPIKQGLDYFPHNTDLSNDSKIEYIEALHGLVGYAVYLKLLEKIYRNGYFATWEERDILIFSRKSNIQIGLCREIVNLCLEEGLFNNELFEKYSILTSHGIQKRYLKSCERRKAVSLYKECLCISEKEIVDIMGTKCRVDVDIYPQRKEKENKVKKIPPHYPPPSECFEEQFSNGQARTLVNQDEQPKKRKRARTQSILSGEQLELFERFYCEYPKKRSRGNAEKAWLKINPDEQLVEKMITTLRRAKTSEEWCRENGKYILHPATWLNAKGWEDEFTTMEDLKRAKEAEQQRLVKESHQRMKEKYGDEV